jgi:hypothetical protein
MNTLLSKHRPKEESKEAFEKMWDNLGYGLSALYSTLEELKSQASKIKYDDFECPNHYARLAYEAGKREAYQQVMDLLPESSKNILK